jgi:hypothetical protein
MQLVCLHISNAGEVIFTCKYLTEFLNMCGWIEEKNC